MSAPAGTGKTVLTSSWARRHPEDVRWLSLDDGDMAAPLWPRLVGALELGGAQVRLPDGVNEGNEPLPDALATTLAVRPHPVVLVLDCDAPLPADVAAGLDHLLRRSHERLRLVLLTRADPLLPLHRYRLAGTLTEIRTADLAFTPDEARVLLAAAGLDLSPVAADAVTARTQGWAAGLRLAALALATRAEPEQAVHDLRGDTGAVAEYLIAELLDSQSPEARQLLLDTSIADVLRPGLVEALAGPRAERDVALLAKGNVLIEELAERPGWFRYHALFRELLRAQLAYESPARLAPLHRAAATWLAGHDMVEDAVRHDAAAGAWDDAAWHVIDNLALGQVLVQQPPVLRDTLAALPADVEGVAPALVRAALALTAADDERCLNEVAQARELLAGARDGWTEAELAAECLTLAQASASSDAERALQAARAAAQLLDSAPRERLRAHPELPALIHSGDGAAQLLRGSLDLAAHAFTQGVHAGYAPGREAPVGSCLGHLALIAALRCQLRRATDLAAQTVALHQSANLHAEPNETAEIALAWVGMETYDLAGASRHTMRAAAASQGGGNDPLAATMLALVTSRVRHAHGDLVGALEVLDGARAAVPALPAWMQDELRLEQATLDLVGGRATRAVSVIEELADTANPAVALLRSRASLALGADTATPTVTGTATPLAVRVNSLLLDSHSHLTLGEEELARRAVERALLLAAPEHLRRPFREAPAEVRRLMRLDGDLLARHRWLGARGQRGYAHAPSRGHRAGEAMSSSPLSARLLEPLTPKEQEVLEHLAALEDTEEIAGAMFVSVNTVRTHVRNILRKFAVSRRNQAVRLARELNLLTAEDADRGLTPSG
ncbi:LuxR C-terminal-related transcriptional regulator [Georgenia sp. SYP-B2076]|uniref:LuxR C-terminal-related transcriptional regulator n=1 Tax=Georgenia sp. SYP-B2076 TaxID=2495881 RepID=UPI00197A9ACB|nr:LuxR C-terminal-related transcriptional regulator [Georgenia sp. SYP-B2076]